MKDYEIELSGPTIISMLRTNLDGLESDVSFIVPLMKAAGSDGKQFFTDQIDGVKSLWNQVKNSSIMEDYKHDKPVEYQKLVDKMSNFDILANKILKVF